MKFYIYENEVSKELALYETYTGHRSKAGEVFRRVIDIDSPQGLERELKRENDDRRNFALTIGLIDALVGRGVLEGLRCLSNSELMGVAQWARLYSHAYRTDREQDAAFCVMCAATDILNERTENQHER